jgi:hypothetical protein
MVMSAPVWFFFAVTSTICAGGAPGLSCGPQPVEVSATAAKTRLGNAPRVHVLAFMMSSSSTQRRVGGDDAP